MRSRLSFSWNVSAFKAFVHLVRTHSYCGKGCVVMNLWFTFV